MSGIGLCLVGPGGIAGEHVRAHDAGGLSEKLWVVGPTVDAASAFAGTWGFRHATVDLDRALADDDVEVVLVASPNQLHAEQTLRALDAGKHVIVEIPLALTLDDAEVIVARSHAVGRRVFVCHTMRSFPAVRWLRERVAAGELAISQITGFAATPRRHNENWVGGTREWIDNVLWHNSCHYLDASLWVLGAGEVESVCAQFGRPNPEFGMKMDVAVSFKTPKNEIVSYTGTYNVAHEASRMQFVADEALFTLERRRLSDDEGNELFAAGEWTEITDQDGAMVAAIRSGAPSDFDVDTVLPVMRLLARAQEWDSESPVSAQTNRRSKAT
jgi:2-hydroxy-4-carboxymuconate semialdehyde hemiacetal dehydrogenase